MSKVTMDEFESTGDPMLDDNFEIIFSKLPVNGQDGAKSLHSHQVRYSPRECHSKK